MKKDLNQEEILSEIEEQDQMEEAVEETEEKTELEICQQEVLQWKDQTSRVFADFQNFKKRTEREQVQWMQTAQEKVLKDLLAIVDNFDRALLQKTDENAAVYEGIEMIYKATTKLLEKYDVKPFDTYETFDPEFHEALMHTESDDVESGQIVTVLEKGFMIKDRVLRPAKVSVAK